MVKLTHNPLDNMSNVTQWYGEHPEGLPYHIGIDYSVPVGTPVYAAHDGIVETKHQPSGFGHVTNVVSKDGTWMTTYGHLSTFIKRYGDVVKAGDEIALSGNSGKTTGPHMHFGLRLPGWNMQDGKFGYSDPKPYLPEYQVGEALNRFGFYFLNRVDAYSQYLSKMKPAWVTVHQCSKSKVDSVRAASPSTKILGRLYESDQWYLENIMRDPIGTAGVVANKLMATDWARHVDAVLTSNEVCLRWDQLDNLNAYYLSLQSRLPDIPLGLYSASVENPPWDKTPWHESLMLHWQKLYPSMRAGLQHGDYLLLHQYNAPRLWLGDYDDKPGMENLNTNRIVRYEHNVYDHLPDDIKPLPVVMAEFGWDFLLWPFYERRGWLDDRAATGTPDAIGQLNHFADKWDKLYSHVPVQGWVLFSVEDSGGWEYYQANHDTTPSGQKRTPPLLEAMADTLPGGDWYLSRPVEPPVEPPIEPKPPIDPPPEDKMDYPRVYDADGVEQDWDWLVQNYGQLIYQPAQGLQHGEQYWKLVRMQENKRDNSTKVRTIDEDGQAHAGNNASFHWPDAPRHESGCASHWDKKFKFQTTDSDGYTAFSMGTGSYYWPPDIGIHKVWICGGTKSDMIQGIGMLSGTDHHNVADLVFALTTYDAQNPPPPNPDPDPQPPPSDTMKAMAADIKALKEYIVDGKRR